MTSRKKQQGKGRKAKKAKQAYEARRDRCLHFIPPEGCTREDWNVCLKLVRDLDINLHHTSIEVDEDAAAGKTLDHLQEVYEPFLNEYIYLNDLRKCLVRSLLLGADTNQCIIDERNGVLNIPESNVSFVAMTIHLIDAMSKYNGDLSNISKEMIGANDILGCARNRFHFFHRCDCLHKIYYELKNSTSRTSLCLRCAKSVNVRQIYPCECSCVQYCSVECAKSDFRRHKHMCPCYTTRYAPAAPLEEVD